MIILSNEQMEQLHKIELEMLIEVDRICNKNNIRYTIIGGTLIGAIRNKGFIPWDDDVDIAMLRSDYEKFRVACKKDLDKTRFYFQDDRNTKGYRWGYGKLRRKNTLFVRENQEHMIYKQGVFLDIFPHDGVPNNYLIRAIHNFKCFIIRKMLWSEVGKKCEKNIIKHFLYVNLSKIPHDVIRKMYYSLVNVSKINNKKRVRALMFPTFGKDFGYNIEWFKPGENIEFEGHMFQCMKGAKEYLSYSYGDYMKLPPYEERKIHPVSKIKLIDVDIK